MYRPTPIRFLGPIWFFQEANSFTAKTFSTSRRITSVKAEPVARLECIAETFSVLALAIGALTFQSCEVYPNGTSRGYNHGGYYGDGYAGDHYGDGYYGGGVVVSSGYREYDHGYGYNNRYYSGENTHVNRNVNVNRTVQTNRNVNVNRNAQVNRSVHVSRNAHGNPSVHANPNAHGKPKVHGNPNTDVRKQ
jgi:hypothetical protein